MDVTLLQSCLNLKNSYFEALKTKKYVSVQETRSPNLFNKVDKQKRVQIYR